MGQSGPRTENRVNILFLSRNNQIPKRKQQRIKYDDEEHEMSKQQMMAEMERRLEIKRAKRESVAASASDSATSTKHGGSDSDEDESFTCYEDKDVDDAYEKIELKLLLIDAEMLRNKHYLGPEEERRTCIWPGGNPISWTELSTGHSWIGVKGTDTTCVVSSSDPICKRPDGKAQLPCHAILRGALADMLGDTKFSYHGRIPQSFHAGPLAVVSVAPGLPGQEASRAINFLREKRKDFSSLSSEETAQTAICALKYLLGPNFNPSKIEISGWGKYNGVEGRMWKKHVMHAIRQILDLDRNT